jgi:3-oxoacyl-[acyl-carrier-protein] synthase-3
VQLAGVDADKFIQTYQYLGNVGPANLGIALSTAVQERRLQDGMRVALVAVGSGINCLMAEVIW